METNKLEAARNLLRNAGYLIDICWTIEDISQCYYRKHGVYLTREACEDIAVKIVKHFDSSYGTSWDSIDSELWEVEEKVKSLKASRLNAFLTQEQYDSIAQDIAEIETEDEWWIE